MKYLDKKKIIYIMLLLFVTLFVSVTCFSYAFFMKDYEYHGKINIIAGTLDFKLSSKNLNGNNQITVPAETSKDVEIEVTNLNDISVEYELYYETDNNDVVVKYTTLKDNVRGTINVDSSKRILVNITNNSNTNANVTFKTQGGFLNNEFIRAGGNTIAALPLINVALDANRGNLVDDGWNLLSFSLANITKTGSDYVIRTAANTTSGAYIESRMFEDGKKYKLNFNIQKLSGTLKNIGGHAAAASNLSFKIDGVDAGNYFINANTGAINIANDENVHNIELIFTYLPNSTSAANKDIFIQPNRGFNDVVRIKITDFEATELPDTIQLEYGQEYGNLPSLTKTGYVFLGWNGKNKFNKSEYLTTEDYNISNVYKWKEISLEENTSYKINVVRFNGFDGKNNGHVLMNDSISLTSNWTAVAHEAGPNITSLNNSYTTDSSGLLYIGYYPETTNQQNLDVIWANTDIQIEKGNTMTPYEAYYVSQTTPVTQTTDHTLVAVWEKENATFVTGREFNGKIKKLSGDVNGAYNLENTTITSIRRYTDVPTQAILSNAQIISTPSSNLPIYAWFDNGTIYYYTKAIKPYMNSDSSDMFQYLSNVTNIDINTLDTSRATSMQGLFNLDINLLQLDLSNFNTLNTESIYAAFRDCQSIVSLDLSSFDLSNVTNSIQPLTRMTSLKSLKTPKNIPSGVTIELPTTLYDSNNNAYTILNSSSPTETWLTDGQ